MLDGSVQQVQSFLVLAVGARRAKACSRAFCTACSISSSGVQRLSAHTQTGSSTAWQFFLLVDLNVARRLLATAEGRLSLSLPSVDDSSARCAGTISSACSIDATGTSCSMTSGCFWRPRRAERGYESDSISSSPPEARGLGPALLWSKARLWC
jgi:hypothetical protein